MRRLTAAAMLLVATPAWAQDEPCFCPNRPSLGSSACTTAPGQVQAELSAADWERDSNASSLEDSVVAGDLLLRFGLGPSTEAQVGWVAFGHDRVRDRLTGEVDAVDGVGDVRLALRQNLANPDGSGLSYGVEPFVTLPTGRTGVGAGDWGAGVQVPVTYELDGAWSVGFTGEGDAAVDEDGSGRHLAYSGIVTLNRALSDAVTATVELMLARDNDPAGHETQAVAAASVAWQPASTWQVDALAAFGINRDTPDLRLVLGGAILFR